jgi:hypothetical protein
MPRMNKLSPYRTCWEDGDHGGSVIYVKTRIVYRFFSAKSAPMYVSERKGDGGVDWGYTGDIKKARVLNRNEWQSFAKDMRECGSAAFALAREG